MTFNDDQYEERGFLQKFGFPIGIGAVGLVVIALVAGQMMKGKKEAPRKAQEVVMVRPLPTPPPPPQPKPPEPPKETMDQMVKQEALTPDDEKPDEAPQPAASGITTSNTGSGGVDMGLGAAGKGGQGSIGGTRGPRTQFGWYAAPLQNLIQGILSRNGLTNKAKFENVVRIWVDGSGRIVRVKLSGTTGDASIDQAIVEALNKLQLTQSPPAEMPMPIVMRLSARRPN